MFASGNKYAEDLGEHRDYANIVRTYSTIHSANYRIVLKQMNENLLNLVCV